MPPSSSLGASLQKVLAARYSGVGRELLSVSLLFTHDPPRGGRDDPRGRDRVGTLMVTLRETAPGTAPRGAGAGLSEPEDRGARVRRASGLTLNTDFRNSVSLISSVSQGPQV